MPLPPFLRCVAIAAFALAWPNWIQAQRQAVVLTGRIVDATAGSPLSGVIISIEGTTLLARSNSAGEFQLSTVPPGPRVVRAIRIGYAPLRHNVVVPIDGVFRLDLALARNALALPGLLVTEDPSGRARGELGTASVIGEEAIRNQTAASLAGILELVPGTLLQPPGLDGVQQFGLRAVPIGGGASPGVGTVSATDASLLASFGTQIVLDGVPVSNNVNLQSLGARGELTFATASGGGIDLRRIPAATVERVEVIRGLPSSRFGDLTQGVVLVDTRAGAVDPEARVRVDARTLEATVLGGRSAGRRQAATASVNVARTRLAPGFRDNTGSRVSSQLAHRREGERITLDTRFDAFHVLDDQPPTNRSPDFSSRSRDNGFRLSERLRWNLGERNTLDWTAAYEGIRQRSFTQSPRLRGAMPFTNRLTEGTQDGKFIGGTYVARAEVNGDPRHFYSRLETRVPRTYAHLDHDLRAGVELRREWNGGPGYLFDVEFPPQVEFNGVNGYDRPWSFEAIPPLVTSAAYIDDRVAHILGRGWMLSVQAGARVDVMHSGSMWTSGARDHLVQPRLQVELAPTDHFRVRAGAGTLAKVPTLGTLFPAPQYYDLVNFNWYANEPAERRTILTTRILERHNPQLDMSRADKREVGLELDIGGGSQIAVVGYADRIRGGVGIDLDPAFLIRDHYAVDSTTVNQGRPPDVLQPPAFADTVPVLVDRPANNLDLRSTGLELTAVFPEIEPLRLRIATQAAWSWSRLASSGADFGSEFGDFQLNERRSRSPYWENVIQKGERLLITTRLIHHQPSVGLVVTGTVQLFVRELRVNEAGTDTLAFAGYINRRGELVPIPPEDRGAPQYQDLRKPRLGLLVVPQEGPVDWLFSIQVSKSLPRGGRFAFYAFNALDRVGTYAGRTTVPRLFPAIRFGLEVTMPLGLGWGQS